MSDAGRSAITPGRASSASPFRSTITSVERRPIECSIIVHFQRTRCQQSTDFVFEEALGDLRVAEP